MNDVLQSLNPMQQEAVQAIDGPLLILAGAGSGKTTVLVNRIAYMLQQGISPYQILAITFTNKAANEMKTRVDRLYEHASDDIWVSTFHSMCVRILRRYIDRIGYDRSFTIYDSSDSQALMKDCLKELNIDDKDLTPRGVLSQISRAKDDLVDASAFAEMHEGNYRMSRVAALYQRYQDQLRKNNALDFDDIIVNTVRLLEQDEEVRSYYQNKFRYIMVDEYQDTNNAQYVLISLLAGRWRNLCVVGDDDQSIYKFRGANIRNILDFEQDYPDARVIKLEQNYRSTQTILNAANAVIANNHGRKGKKLWTKGEEGDKIFLYHADNEHDEGRFIAREIDRLVSEGGMRFSDFVILYRTNAQSRILEEMLLRQGLPYRVLAGLRFYDRKEIKDILAYLRIIANSADSVSLKRIINEPRRGIGAVTIGKAEAIAAEMQLPLFDVMAHADQYPDLARSAVKLISFTKQIDHLRSQADSGNLVDFVEKVCLETGYRSALMLENTIEAKARIENLDEFLSVVKEYESTAQSPTLSEFLESVSLVSDIDNYDEEQSAVVLMTIHSAKGLEFDTVFLAGMEEGLFPGSRSMFEEEELEEERRLCYVALTRAKRRLYISCAHMRLLFGQTSFPMPSRFVREIPQECIMEFGKKKRSTDHTQAAEPANRAPVQKTASAISSFASMTKESLFSAFDVRKKEKQVPSFAEGERVLHKKFGEGVITAVTPLGNDQKLTIAFDTAGTKNLMAMFANLKKL